MKRVLLTIPGLAVIWLARNLDVGGELIGSFSESSIDASLEISCYALVDSLAETSSASSSGSSSASTQQRRARRYPPQGVGPGNQISPQDYNNIPHQDRPYGSGPGPQGGTSQGGYGYGSGAYNQPPPPQGGYSPPPYTNGPGQPPPPGQSGWVQPPSSGSGQGGIWSNPDDPNEPPKW